MEEKENLVIEDHFTKDGLTDLKVVYIDENTKEITLENEIVHAVIDSSELQMINKNILNSITLGQWIEVTLKDKIDKSNVYKASINSSNNLNLESRDFCDNLIRKIYEENNSLIPRKLKSERKQLDRLIGELSKEDLTFLFELIQNAIDHPNLLSKDGVSMRFEIMGDYLFFSHDGAPFKENNFISITGIMHGEDDDYENENARIGYKGIGFKSIFKYTNEVFIKSGNYHFSFSKSKTGAELPWEIFPILESETYLLDELPNFHFLNSNVGFAFKFINENLKSIAQNFLHLLIEESESILFLKKLRKLTIVTDEGINTLTRSVNIKEDHSEVTINSKNQQAKWIVVEKTETIEDSEVIAELKDEEKRISSKYREFRKPTIQIAYPLTEKKNLKNLYTYLPLTKTNFGLPFIINGDFIPDLDRNDLVKLIYNDRLGKISSKVHIQLVNVISRVLNNDIAINTLSNINLENVSGFWIEHFQSLKKMVKEIVLNGEVLTNTIIDTSCLFNKIDIELKNIDNNLKNKSIISKLILENKRLLIDTFDFEEFKLEDACKFLNLEEVQVNLFGSYLMVIKFLKKLNKLPNSKEWQSKFSTDVLLFPKYKDTNIKVPLMEVTFGLKSNFRSLANFNLNKQLLLGLDEKTKIGENIKKLLADYSLFQINKVDLLNMISRKLIDLRKQIQINSNDYKTIKQYINNLWFYLYECKDLKNEENDYFYVNQRFENFPILTKSDNILSLSECKLSEKGEISDEVVEIYSLINLDNINVIDTEMLSKYIGINEQELIKFLLRISHNIKNTDEKLLQNFIKEVSKDKFIRIKKLEFKQQIKLLTLIAIIDKRNSDKPIKLELNYYPIITQTEQLRAINETYLAFPKSMNKGETTAQKLFKDIDGIDFIDEKYFHTNSLSFEEFSGFLERNGLSRGLKYTLSKDLKDNNQDINLSILDKEYFQYNSSRPKFHTTTQFSIINDLIKLSGKNENLKIFWDEVLKKENWDIIRQLSIGNIVVENPFIFLLKKQNLEFFPMQNGVSVNHKQILSKSLEEIVLNPKYKLAFDYKIDSQILKKIPFPSQFNLDQTINIFRNLEKLDFEKIKKFFNLILKKKWEQSELELLMECAKIPNRNKSIMNYKDLIYLNSSFQNGIIDISGQDFPNNIISYEFDYDKKYEEFISLLGIKSYNFTDVSVKSVSDKQQKSNLLTIKDVIDVLKGLNEINEDRIALISEMSLYPCNEIEIHIAEVPEINEVIQAFIDEKQKIIYFKDEWNLAEILSIHFGLSSSPARKLRNRLIEITHLKSVVEVVKSIEKKEDRINEIEKIDSNLDSNKSYEKLGLTEQELQDMERLIKRKLSNDEMENQSIVALYKAIGYYEELGYDLSYSKNNINEILKIKYLKNIRKQDGTSFQSIVRSGLNGMLFLNYNVWIDLQKNDFELAVLTKSVNPFLVLT